MRCQGAVPVFEDAANFALCLAGFHLSTKVNFGDA
jgi:hypothetical protein